MERVATRAAEDPLLPGLIVRDERPGDADVIRRVLRAAFPSDAESRLVDALRADDLLRVALVAELDGRVVGHIGLSPVTVAGSERGLGLAPLAVEPAHQRQGIGAALVAAALQRCRAGSAEFVVVLGEPAYYGRFGFRPASDWGLVDDYEGGAAFQAIELRAGTIPRAAGLVRYAPPFARLAE